MKSAGRHANEHERLRALRSYGNFGSARDEAFQSLVRVASSVCATPIAVITLVEDQRVLYLAEIGMPAGTVTARDHTFSSHVISSGEILIVGDTALDERFAGTPTLVDGKIVRFYAGYPLVDRDGFTLGALCVADHVPRTLSPEKIDILRELATAVVRLLEAKRNDAALDAANEATAVARAELAAVLDAASATVAYWDEEVRNRFANRAFLEAFGCTGEEIRGRHAREVVGEAAFATDGPFWEAALRGEPQRIERTMADAAGRRRRVVVTFAPVIRDGRVLGFVSTENDVTELHDAVVALRQRNDLLNLAEEISGLGHWRADLATGTVYGSPQTYKLFGRDPERPPTWAEAVELIHPDDRTRNVALAMHAAQVQQPYDATFRIVRAGAEIRQVEAKVRCEIDPTDGKTLALFGILSDVTERNAARDRAARQERLLTAGTLAAGVGHEINNPLTYLIANIDFAIEELVALESGSPSNRLKDTILGLADSRDGAERIRKIVRSLRAFARADAPLAPTDIHAAIAIATGIAGHELRTTATVVQELGAVPLVISDESRLAQVLVNLLVNAAQSFPHKDPETNRIVVRTTREPGGSVAIDVADNGPGISDSVRPRIFEPFFTTKGGAHGTGLGLAISQTIVASMNGTLSFSTVPGAGTTFRIVLPRATTETVPPPEEVRRSSSQASTGRRRGKVLVIDDEAALRKLFVRALGAEHDVVVIGDAREALRVVLSKETAFDVIFCDLVMPHITGMDLFERVRAEDPPWPIASSS
jgi:PAS domain S-box-containing protein